MDESHQQCVDAGSHVCQEPSGRTCIEAGCDKPAGTWWGPNWCPEHDKERLDRISGQFEDLAAAYRVGEGDGNAPYPDGE